LSDIYFQICDGPRWHGSCICL